jgi:hypothetical protein
MSLVLIIISIAIKSEVIKSKVIIIIVAVSYNLYEIV